MSVLFTSAQTRLRAQVSWPTIVPFAPDCATLVSPLPTAAVADSSIAFAPLRTGSFRARDSVSAHPTRRSRAGARIPVRCCSSNAARRPTCASAIRQPQLRAQAICPHGCAASVSVADHYHNIVGLQRPSRLISARNDFPPPSPSSV